jgi:class 3 adenylate cyclase/tetratricopeptide (TPR) repeat protein
MPPQRPRADCPECGGPNRERARFCQACGRELALPGPWPLQVRKTVTVLFCDVTGSTTLGEYQDPERLRRVMTEYFDEARSAIERHGGKVEKFIGDAVMAVFGVPAVHEDDALRALRAAADLRDALGTLNDELERTVGARIEVRTGVNTGDVIAGDPNSRDSFVTGAAVNVAERLERAASCGEILIGKETFRLARDAIRAEPLEPLTLKGRSEPVLAYRLLEVYPGVPAHARRFDSPMVDRRRELALLRDAFQRCVGVREHACHLFTVLGAAGMGKSRLVAEALRTIGGEATVLKGSCLAYGEGITFWPVLDVVKQATGVSDEDTPEEARAKIAAELEGDLAAERVADRVAEVIGLAEAGGTFEESGTAEEGFWGVRKLFEALAQKRPLIVVFDDLNWAEPRFLDLIEHVADWSRDAPILLVCMARPELLEIRPGWGGGRLNATTILLESLSDPDSEKLIQSLLGEAAISAEVSRRICDAAAGNPLFVEEMVSMLIDDGLLRRKEGGLVTAADLSRVRVPPTIQALLASRLDQLSAEERRVLEWGAVEGNVFHRGALEELSASGEQDGIARCLTALMRKDLVRSHRAAFDGEDAFCFRHPLIREAAYEALPKQVRGELHEAYADWLEKRPGEYEELLGYHLEQAFQYRRELGRVDEPTQRLAAGAAAHLMAVGRRALAREDVFAGANLLGRSAALLATDDPTRDDVLLELGGALVFAGDFVRADAVLKEAIEAGRRSGDRRLELRSVLERAFLRTLTDSESSVDDLRQVSEHVMAELETLGDDLGLAKAWRRIADSHWMMYRWKDQELAVGRALLYSERAGDAREAAWARMRLAMAFYYGPRPVPEAIRRCRQILEEMPENPVVRPAFIVCLGGLHAMCGRFDEARRHLGQGRSLFEELGLKVWVAGMSLLSADVELLARDAEAAERELRGAYGALERMGERGLLSAVAAQLGRALCAQERYGEAERFAQVSQELAHRDDVAAQMLWRTTRAKILARRQDLEEAESLARQAHEITERTDALNSRGLCLTTLAEVLLLAGREEDAAPLLGQALKLFELKGNVVAAMRARQTLANLSKTRNAATDTRTRNSSAGYRGWPSGMAARIRGLNSPENAGTTPATSPDG